jgi:hypothetical protein
VLAASSNNRTIASAPPCTSQVVASSIRVAASPPANPRVRSDRNHETRAHWAVGQELLGCIAPCRKRPRIDRSRLERESCVLQSIKGMDQPEKTNQRKPTGENQPEKTKK